MFDPMILLKVQNELHAQLAGYGLSQTQIEEAQKTVDKLVGKFIEAAVAPPRTCQKCGRPENNHNVRHPFVGLG